MTAIATRQTTVRPVTASPVTASPITARPAGVRRTWTVVGVATLLAAAATEAVVALVNAIGSDVTLQGKPMPTGGCAVGVLMCMVPAIALLVALRRWAANPARTWVRATAGLVALSLVPDLAVSDTPVGSRLALMTAHLVAAAIIVPAVARVLPRKA